MVRAQPKAAPYHHGRLCEALVEAAMRLVQERGVRAVSVREAARQAGVSSGAPFRHFPTRAALITAVAEIALAGLREQIDDALAAVDAADPLARLGAVMLTYVRWMARNPGLFEVLADRTALDLDAAPALRRGLARGQAQVIDLVSRAAAQGLLRSDDVVSGVLGVRAMAQGLGRMLIDRRLAEWGVDDSAAEPMMVRAMTHCLAGLAADPGRHGLSLPG